VILIIIIPGHNSLSEKNWWSFKLKQGTVGLKQYLITIAKQWNIHFPYSYPPSSHSPVQLADKHVIYLSIGGIWDIHLAPPLGLRPLGGTEWIYHIPPRSRQIALTYQGASLGETEVMMEKCEPLMRVSVPRWRVVESSWGPKWVPSFDGSNACMRD